MICSSLAYLRKKMASEKIRKKKELESITETWLVGVT